MCVRVCVCVREREFVCVGDCVCVWGGGCVRVGVRACVRACCVCVHVSNTLLKANFMNFTY